MSKILKALAVVCDGYGNTADQLAVASTDGSQLAVFASVPPAADALKFKGEVVLRVVIMPEEDYEARNARYDRLQQRLTATDERADLLEGLLRNVRNKRSFGPEDTKAIDAALRRVDSATAKFSCQSYGHAGPKCGADDCWLRNE